MPDNKPFVPTQPEKTTVMEISGKEADLIKKLRRSSYGQFSVFKANGILVRVEIKDSQMLSEDAGLDDNI